MGTSLGKIVGEKSVACADPEVGCLIHSETGSTISLEEGLVIEFAPLLALLHF
jgi:hypothetical protein